MTITKPEIKLIPPSDLLKDHTFLRIWTDSYGNFRSDLDVPPEASAGFGDRTNMELLQKHLLRVTDFVNEVLGSLTAALSESYLAQVQEALKGVENGNQAQSAAAPAEEGSEGGARG